MAKKLVNGLQFAKFANFITLQNFPTDSTYRRSTKCLCALILYLWYIAVHNFKNLITKISLKQPQNFSLWYFQAIWCSAVGQWNGYMGTRLHYKMKETSVCEQLHVHLPLLTFSMGLKALEISKYWWTLYLAVCSENAVDGTFIGGFYYCMENKLILQYLKTRRCKYYTLYNH